MIDKANMYMIISWQGIIYSDNIHATFIYHYHALTVSLMKRIDQGQTIHFVLNENNYN